MSIVDIVTDRNAVGINVVEDERIVAFWSIRERLGLNGLVGKVFTDAVVLRDSAAKRIEIFLC